jgi:hypothetical protein
MAKLKPNIEKSFRGIWPCCLDELRLHWRKLTPLTKDERYYLYYYFMFAFVRPTWRERFHSAFRAQRNTPPRAMYHARSLRDTESTTVRDIWPKIAKCGEIEAAALWCGPEYDMAARFRGSPLNLAVLLAPMQGPAIVILETTMISGYYWDMKYTFSVDIYRP